MSTFTYYIRLTNGRQLPFSGSSSTTIADVRKNAANNSNASVNETFLIFGNSKLQDGNTLGQYKITQGSVIFVAISLKQTKSSTIEVLVKDFNQRTYSLKENPDEPILNVKKHLSAKNGMNYTKINLTYNSQLMLNNKRLSDYNISDKSTIYSFAPVVGGN